jgi:hypothetical protein
MENLNYIFSNDLKINLKALQMRGGGGGGVSGYFFNWVKKVESEKKKVK